VDPAPGELRALLGAPEPPALIVAMLRWDVLRSGFQGTPVPGEFPMDLLPQLVTATGPVLGLGLGRFMPGTEPSELEEDRLASEARVAEVLATWKKDGAVYDFDSGLQSVQDAFEGRIRDARRATLALDALGFLCVVLASLAWGLRGPLVRWLAPLVAAGFLLAWSRLAWEPIGTAAYVWGVKHLALALAGGAVLAAWLLVVLARSFGRLDVRSVEEI